MNDLIINDGKLIQQFNDFIIWLDKKPATIGTYQRALKVFADYCKNEYIEIPKRQDIINFKNKLIAEGKQATTIQSYLTAISKFYKWLSINYNVKNEAQDIERPKVNYKQGFKKGYINEQKTFELMNQFNLNNINDLRNYIIVALSFFCGLRTIEIERANIQDLSNLYGYNVLYIQGKGRDDKNEFVKLPNEIYFAIKKYIESREDKNEALFVSTSNNNNGQRVAKDSISRIVKQALRNIGIDTPKITQHSGRHTLASIMLNNGYSITQISEALRHESEQTTKIYLNSKNRIENNIEIDMYNLIMKPSK